MLSLLQTAGASRNLSAVRAKIFQEHVRHFLTSQKDKGDWKAYLLGGASKSDLISDPSVALDVSLPNICYHFIDAEEVVPNAFGHCKLVLWIPCSEEYNVAMDYIITEGTEVYFIKCSWSSSPEVLVQGETPDAGLFPLADALARNGFNTNGELNFVHVTDIYNSMKCTSGPLKIGRSKRGVTAAQRARVKQYVVAHVPKF